MPSMQRTDAEYTPTDAASTPPDAAVEALHVRNYDVTDAHTVTVSFTAVRGDESFRRRYYLSPGQSESEQGVLPTGTYDVVVHADGLDRAARRIDLGPTPAETALVELGNGITSVSQGVY